MRYPTKFGVGALIVLSMVFGAGDPTNDLPRDNFFLPHTPRAVIHRGVVSESGIENTLDSIAESLGRYPDAEIEVDVRETKDNALVLLHDAELARETNGKGAVREHTIQELRGFSRKDSEGKISDQGITELDDILDFFEQYPAARLQIDAKVGSEKAYEKLAEEVLSRLGLSGRVIISSGDVDRLRFLHEHYPYLRLGYDPGPSFTDEKDANAIIHRVRALGVDTIYLDYTFLRKVSSDDVREYVGELQSAGFEIDVWTVDDPWGFGLTASWGVDKITTNRTDTYELILGTCK